MRIHTAILLWLLASPLFAQSGDDQQALQEVEKLLNSPGARQEFSRGNQDASAVDNFFVKFPAYAQSEMNAIVMLIMNESKSGAQKHVDAYKRGAEAAHQSFSPAVKARISALQNRLMSDRSFNSPENLQMMKSFLPTFLGMTAKN